MHKDAAQVLLAVFGANAAEEPSDFCYTLGYKVPRSIVTN